MRHQSSVELTCREFIEDLAEYLSGELAPERFPHCDAHLSHCPDCVKYYRSYKETIRLSTMTRDQRDETIAMHMPQELARSIFAAVKRTKE